MKIERLYINNYKSLVDFELETPGSFSVFVGPNAAGKSNIFEALEFLSYETLGRNREDLFGGANRFLNVNFIKSPSSKFSLGDLLENELQFEIGSDFFDLKCSYRFYRQDSIIKPASKGYGPKVYYDASNGNEKFTGEQDLQNYQKTFSRIFIKNTSLLKSPLKSSSRLALDASNLEPVLKRILQDEAIREEMIEWLELLIPEFENITVHSDNIGGHDTLLIKEKYTDQPFDKNLLSDGTYNILALLTVVYQSSEPQFLCIEEPENGLNPYVVRKMVEFFRHACETKGHVIWLNTHSQTLVKALKPEEIILVDKKEGITKAKKLNSDMDLKDIPLDEAWLTNMLGGGVPW